MDEIESLKIEIADLKDEIKELAKDLDRKDVQILDLESNLADAVNTAKEAIRELNKLV